MTERKCSYYQYDRNKDYYDLNRRWHIVSAVLSIMPEAERIPCMDLLRDFRVNVLEKGAMFEKALRIYDVVGPFLARELVCDTKRDEICELLLKNWLVDVAQMIQQGEYIDAFEKYAEMVNTLSGYYGKKLTEYMTLKQMPVAQARISL